MVLQTYWASATNRFERKFKQFIPFQRVTPQCLSHINPCDSRFGVRIKKYWQIRNFNLVRMIERGRLITSSVEPWRSNNSFDFCSVCFSEHWAYVNFRVLSCAFLWLFMCRCSKKMTLAVHIIPSSYINNGMDNAHPSYHPQSELSYTIKV